MLAPDKNYVDLSKPSIAGLCYALRHKEVWPTGFEWNWAEGRSCAMGLARMLWPEEIGNHISTDVGGALGISPKDAEWLFCCTPVALYNEMGISEITGITPEMVADLLEKMTK